MPGKPRTASPVSLEAAMVARRYYLGNLQKNEIAAELGISRFKVARLLDEARASGIVRIHIDVPAEIDMDLGDRVAERYGLRRVIPARTLNDEPDSLWPVVGAAAAQYLESILGPTDVLGISWGRALASTVEAFALRTGTDVVQIVGGVNASSSEVGGVELVRRLSEVTGGRAFPMNAPLLMGSRATAEALRRDPSLAETIRRFPDLTVAVVGVGAWGPTFNSAVANELTAQDRQSIAERGVVADVAGLLVDATGNPVASEVSGRTIGVDYEELQRIPEVVAVAAGADKVNAIAAVARSGMISTLVTDAHTASGLLRV